MAEETRFVLQVVGHRLEAAWFRVDLAKPANFGAIVLLHEGLGCVDAWRDFPRRVCDATARDVLVYSRLGYGNSDRVSVPRPLRYMHDEARTLAAVARVANIERAIFIGHSDGASIAIIAAGTDGGHGIDRIALLAPHVFCEARSIEGIEQARDAFVHGDLRARLAKYHADVDGAFWGWNGAWLDPKFRAWNIEEFLPAIQMPVLAIQGEDDAYGTLAQLDAIQAQVRGPFTRLVLPHVGHSPHRDAPEETLAAIEKFCSAR